MQIKILQRVETSVCVVKDAPHSSFEQNILVSITYQNKRPLRAGKYRIWFNFMIMSGKEGKVVSFEN